MKKIVFLSLTLIALLPSSMAQFLPLLSGERNELSLDINSIYSYNQYEKSRWGLGLQYDIVLDSKRFRALVLSGYGAYGYEDKRFKWGLKADLQSKLVHQTHSYVMFFHDLTPDGTRLLEPYQLLSFTSTGSFMTRLFSDTYRLTLGFSRQASLTVTQCFELRLSRERYLHEGNTLYYPSSYSDLKDLKPFDFAEGRIFVAHNSGLRGELLIGAEGSWQPARPGDPDTYEIDPFLRLLLQYERMFDFSAFELNFFAQGGVTNEGAPYSRIFDLGGTWGSPIAMGRSLLTARPNEFAANMFALVCMKLSTESPLFDLESSTVAIGTAPTPFLLCNAAWGTGLKYAYPTAPVKGIAEVGAGIDGVLIWGAIKWGCAAVYRLTPASADYHYTDTRDNLALLFTARIDL